MKRICVIAATVLLGWAGVAHAGPLELKNVPANAKWVAHVDFDAAHSSPVVQAMLKQVAKDWPGAAERVGKFCHKVGLDDCKDLHAATAYGTTLERHKGVLILQAKWNAKALQEKAEKAPDHKTSKYGKYEIHTWTAHKGSKHAHQVAGTLYKPDVLVLASSPESLTAAINALDGKAASLAGKQSPLADKVSPGAIVVARAVDLKDSPAAKMHPVLQLVKSFAYEEGEHDGRWFGNLAVAADSKPVAGQLAKVFEGYNAWLSLHGHKSPWFVDLINKVKVSSDGKVVKATFQEPAGTLVALMPKMSEVLQEHLKLHKAMMEKHCKMMQEMKEMHKESASASNKSEAKCCPKCPMMKKNHAAGTTTGGTTKK